MILDTITKTCFVLSLRSLLSCFQHSRTNHCPYLRTRPIIFSRCITLSAFFFVVKLVFFVMVLETIIYGDVGINVAGNGREIKEMGATSEEKRGVSGG